MEVSTWVASDENLQRSMCQFHKSSTPSPHPTSASRRNASRPLATPTKLLESNRGSRKTQSKVSSALLDDMRRLSCTCGNPCMCMRVPFYALVRPPPPPPHHLCLGSVSGGEVEGCSGVPHCVRRS